MEWKIIRSRLLTPGPDRTTTPSLLPRAWPGAIEPHEWIHYVERLSHAIFLAIPPLGTTRTVPCAVRYRYMQYYQGTSNIRYDTGLLRRRLREAIIKLELFRRQRNVGYGTCIATLKSCERALGKIILCIGGARGVSDVEKGKARTCLGRLELMQVWDQENEQYVWTLRHKGRIMIWEGERDDDVEEDEMVECEFEPETQSMHRFWRSKSLP